MSKGNDAVSQIIGQHLTGVAARYLNQRSDNNADLLYSDNFRALAEMSLSRFEWINLPATVHPNYVEKSLFYKGCVIFFKDDPVHTNAFFALQGHGTGMLNMYDEHIRYQITAPNFRQKSLLAENCVPIWSNDSRVPDALRCAMYANKLTEIDVSFDINTKQVRRSRTLVADENQRMTMASINDSIDRGDPVIYLTRSLDPGALDTVDFGVSGKDLIDLHQARQRVWAEAMTKMGVDNANQDKAERLVSDEVDANNAQIGAMRNGPLEQRKEAARLINKKYGLKIEVRYRETGTDTGTETNNNNPNSTESESDNNGDSND
ncbi:portal protein [Microbacterium phage Curie]